ncbi:hypothetical protein PS1_014449 [Malus domestica]
MSKASEGFLSAFVTRVCLDSELVPRKEPFGGSLQSKYTFSSLHKYKCTKRTLHNSNPHQMPLQRHRNLRPGLLPLLDQSPLAIYLSPSTKSLLAVNLSNLPASPLPLVLVVLNAFHSREMSKEIEGFLLAFATRVCLDSELVPSKVLKNARH